METRCPCPSRRRAGCAVRVRVLRLGGGARVDDGLLGDCIRAVPARQIAATTTPADQNARQSQGEQGMGASSTEIERQIGETRSHLDANLTVLEARVASG